jgi:hypothetical protein
VREWPQARATATTQHQPFELLATHSMPLRQHNHRNFSQFTVTFAKLKRTRSPSLQTVERHLKSHFRLVSQRSQQACAIRREFKLPADE